MLTLSLSDLDRLTKGQREALSGFILSFNSPYKSEKYFPKDEPTPTEEVESELSPEVAFGKESTAVADFSVADYALKSITGALVAKTAQCGLDNSGLPWDERIHSSSKAFNADATWRKKRGVSDALVAEVELQLKALMNVPAPVHIQAEVAQVPPPPAEVLSFPVASPVPLPPDFDPKKAFVNFIQSSAQAVREGKITQEEVKNICIKHGVPDIPLLGNRLDLVPVIAIEVEQLIVSR